MGRNVNFTFRGAEAYLQKLSRMEQATDELLRRMIYAGADVVADAVRAEIDKLPEVPRHAYGTRDHMLDGITEAQKAGLLDGLGITPIRRENGGYNAKIGFAGYNGVRTPQYPKGQPNVVIARSVDSGTSFRQKQPFVSEAVKKSRRKALEAMQQVFDEDTDHMMK